MRRVGIFWGVVLAVVMGVEGSVCLAGEVSGGCAADSVVVRLFERLRAGDAAGARVLFRAEDVAQTAAVEGYVSAGVEFMAKMPIEVRVLEVFSVGEYAVCALEQSSPAMPGRRELESGCLIRVDDCWRLLPQPQVPQDRVNALSSKQISTYDFLLKEYAAFKQKYLAYQANNPKE